MNPAEILGNLWTWTPFLLGGLGWNLLISLAAAVFGTAVGAALAWVRFRGSAKAAKASKLVSTAFNRVPTLAMAFYLAVLIPNEFELPWSAAVVHIPAWIKVALALSSAQIGFSSLNLVHYFEYWVKGQHGAALLFVPSWCSNLLITIIASSAASLMGVSEIVSRCNTIINATSHTDLTLPIYLYASLIFLAVCLPLTLAMKRLQALLGRRFGKAA